MGGKTVNALTSDPIFQRNYERFLARFPKLALLSLEFEGGGSSSAEEISSLDIGEINVLYIYGLGMGHSYHSLKNWLQKDLSRDLVFLEDDPAAITSFLKAESSFEILEDRQVHIHFLQEESIEELAEIFPVRTIEVTATPSYLERGEFEELRLQLFRKTVLTESIFLDRAYSYVPFRNLLLNLRQFPSSFLVNGMMGAFENVPAIICGAGPSLEDSIDVLRDLDNKAIIIAGGSTLSSLSHYGVRPHYGVLVDPNLDEYHRMRSNWNFEIPLVYATRVCPEVFDTMNVDPGYLRAGIGGMGELWMDERLKIKNPLMGASLSDEAISVTTISLALAHEFGCNPIILNGIDMAFTNEKQYAKGVQGYKPISIEDLERKKLVENRVFQRKDKDDNSVFTSVKWLMESSCLSAFAKKHPEKTFLNATGGGIGIEGIEHISLEEIKEKYLSTEYDILSWIDSTIRQNQIGVSEREIQKEIEELHADIQNIEENLSIILSEVKEAQKDPTSITIPFESGKMVLAEMDLEENDAFAILFRDIPSLLERVLQRKSKNSSPTHEQHLKMLEEKWTWLHQIVAKYLKVFTS